MMTKSPRTTSAFADDESAKTTRAALVERAEGGTRLRSFAGCSPNAVGREAWIEGPSGTQRMQFRQRSIVQRKHIAATSGSTCAAGDLIPAT